MTGALVAGPVPPEILAFWRGEAEWCRKHANGLRRLASRYRELAAFEGFKDWAADAKSHEREARVWARQAKRARELADPAYWARSAAAQGAQEAR